MARIGINHEKIAQVFISHFHPDHTADLIHFLFVTRNPPTFEKRTPFMITGPIGFAGFLKQIQKAYDPWLDLPSEMMRIEELDTRKSERRAYRNFDITSQPITHTPHSLAYRVAHRSGRSFVYSGDTGTCDEIVELAADCDLLVLDCSFPDGQNAEGHLTPSAAGTIASLSGCKKLLLMHFYPEVLSTDIASQCRGTYKGELILGRDLLHVRI